MVRAVLKCDACTRRSVNGNLTASDINRANVLARNPHVKMFDPSPIHKVQCSCVPEACCSTHGVRCPLCPSRHSC